MRKVFLLFCIVVFSISKYQAQIFLANHTSEPVYIALTMYYGKKNFKSWISEGWYINVV